MPKQTDGAKYHQSSGHQIYPKDLRQNILDEMVANIVCVSCVHALKCMQAHSLSHISECQRTNNHVELRAKRIADRCLWIVAKHLTKPFKESEDG
jgi:hypothetical protein